MYLDKFPPRAYSARDITIPVHVQRQRNDGLAGIIKNYDKKIFEGSNGTYKQLIYSNAINLQGALPRTALETVLKEQYKYLSTVDGDSPPIPQSAYLLKKTVTGGMFDSHRYLIEICGGCHKHVFLGNEVCFILLFF